MTTPIELAREIIRHEERWPLFGFPESKVRQLAQAVIDSPAGLTKGKRMPETPEQFAYMAEKYEEALLREKDENSRLRAKLNKCEQKETQRESYQRGHAAGVKEQKEKDVVIAEEYAEEKGSYDQMGYCTVIAKAIREG